MMTPGYSNQNEKEHCALAVQKVKTTTRSLIFKLLEQHFYAVKIKELSQFIIDLDNEFEVVIGANLLSKEFVFCEVNVNTMQELSIPSEKGRHKCAARKITC